MRGWKRMGWMGLACVAACGMAAATELKVATVSMERVFDEYYKTKEANANFKARADEVDVKRRELVGDVKGAKVDLEALSSESRDKSLSDSAREKKKRAAEEKFSQYKDAEEKLMEFDKAQKKTFGDQMREAQKGIVKEIGTVIQAYAKEKGFTLVLDSSGKTMNSIEALVYADPALDITEPIMTLLNKDAPKSDASAAKPAAAPAKSSKKK